MVGERVGSWPMLLTSVLYIYICFLSLDSLEQ